MILKQGSLVMGWFIGEGLVCIIYIYISREEFTVDCKQGSLRGYLNGKRIHF